jgi:molybdopterin molybdotransferase
MIAFEDALEIISRESVFPTREKGFLHDTPGRVLAGDVLSDIDMPPFNKSAMDGFACRRSGLGQRLKVVETVRAGDIPQKFIETGECSRIMTGARVPGGADCVVMIEHTEIVDDGWIRFTGSETADNIARQAEDIKKGEIVLHKGSMIRPQHVGILASVGCTFPVIYKRPRIAIIATGDELVEPGEILSGTFIRNSNGPQLTAQVNGMGASAHYLGIVKDDPGATRTAIDSALKRFDMVIVTGGVSMGDFDFVPSVLQEAGVRLFFEKVAVKPGRPTIFGRKGKVFVFGLPGNPVSSFTIFELMVKPLIFRMMGHTYRPVEIKLPISTRFSRKKSDRISWTPVSLSAEGMIVPEGYHGSGHLHSLSGAVGLMAMPAGVVTYEKGDLVNVRQI